MKKKLYIAYGSNLNKEQMNYRCPDSEFVRVGTISHYRLEFRHVLTIVSCPGSSVPVAVWNISAKDRSKLDLFEAAPRLYRQEQLHVDLSDGTGCSGMAYVMNGGYLAPPSTSYFNIVAQGFRDCGLDESVLQQALKESRDKITRLRQS